MTNLDHYYEQWEERASIKEHDGNEPKVLAERRAFFEIIDRFCVENDVEKESEERKMFYEELRGRIKENINDLKYD